MMRKHYCFLRKESARKDDVSGAFAYRLAKQDLFIKDIERYGIRVVLVDEYHEITSILKLVETRHKSRTVFISGAAESYGSKWTRDEALQFVHNLSSELIKHEFRIVTGLGLGIGATVVDGALQQIYRVQKRSLTDQLVIRPFPQTVEGKQLWRAYREDMLDHAGLAVFMFGNKIGAGPSGVVRSDGVAEEFDIAHSKGLKLLPLGFTDYVAKELWASVNAAFDVYYPKATVRFRELFGFLGDPAYSLAEQLQHTLEALLELQRQ
jgi:hypothetical protein